MKVVGLRKIMVIPGSRLHPIKKITAMNTLLHWRVTSDSSEAMAERSLCLTKLAHFLGNNMGITKWTSWLLSWWGCWLVHMPRGTRRGAACSNHHTLPVGLCMWEWLRQQTREILLNPKLQEPKRWLKVVVKCIHMLALDDCFTSWSS